MPGYFLGISGYATVDTTNVFSTYFLTVDMHRFVFMWLACSGNKFFRVNPRKNLVLGTNFTGVQMKRDRPSLVCSKCALLRVWNETSVGLDILYFFIDLAIFSSS